MALSGRIGSTTENSGWSTVIDYTGGKGMITAMLISPISDTATDSDSGSGYAKIKITIDGVSTEIKVADFSKSATFPINMNIYEAICDGLSKCKIPFSNSAKVEIYVSSPGDYSQYFQCTVLYVVEI